MIQRKFSLLKSLITQDDVVMIKDDQEKPKLDENPEPILKERISLCTGLNTNSLVLADISTDNYRSSKPPRCWLCNRSDAQEDLFIPCECPREVGLIHKHCLLDWINTLYKGRCPRCAFMYRVRTDHTPWRDWEADTLLKRRRFRHLLALVCTVVFTLIVVLTMVFLTHGQGEDRKKRKFKVTLTIVVVLTYLVYIFYQIRVYTRIYERLKIFNNRVLDVCDIQEAKKQSNFQARGNLSSLINQSELNNADSIDV